jgi:hypothetical protein
MSRHDRCKAHDNGDASDDQGRNAFRRVGPEENLADAIVEVEIEASSRFLSFALDVPMIFLCC